MNYGKKSVSKKRNSLISRTAMMGKRAHVSFIRVLFAVLITICVVVGCTGIYLRHLFCSKKGEENHLTWVQTLFE